MRKFSDRAPLLSTVNIWFHLSSAKLHLYKRIYLLEVQRDVCWKDAAEQTPKCPDCRAIVPGTGCSFTFHNDVVKDEAKFVRPTSCVCSDSVFVPAAFPVLALCVCMSPFFSNLGINFTHF